MGEWLEPTDERWHATLRAARHDFYHLPCYAALAASTEGGVPRAYYAEAKRARLLIPLLVRSLEGVPGAPPGARDATSPYGYGGPVLTPGWSESDVRSAIATFTDDGGRYGLVTSFLRTHPLLQEFGTLWDDQPGVEVVAQGPTVSIDLTRDVDVLNSDVRAEYKRNVSKLRGAGFQATFDAWDDYADFQLAYAQTMQRHRAAPRYHFNPGYFAGLRAGLGSALHLCSVVSPEGDLACGGLFTLVDGIVEYHLSATVDRHRPWAPSKLMLFEVRLWARERGGVVLHLGGGVGGKPDSLYAFKRGFGSHEHVFKTVRVIHDHQALAALNAHWLAVSRRTRFPDDGFFPLYRSAASPLAPSEP